MRKELADKRMNFKQLSRALESIDVKEDSKVLSNKINRGTFSFIFFLQCMRAIGTQTIRLPD